MYPLWLGIPGHFLKLIGLDTNFMIINSIYFQHCVIWIIGDYHMYLFVRQLLGKREAILAILFSVTSEYVNNYVLRTSANSVEGNLMWVVFYYYLNIKPKIFDKALCILTFAITLSFSIRSSSITGYIPLALCRIFEDFDYFLPIVVAGLAISIPLIILNLLSDSYFYGYFTVP
jgi:hypothetical protein